LANFAERPPLNGIYARSISQSEAPQHSNRAAFNGFLFALNSDTSLRDLAPEIPVWERNDISVSNAWQQALAERNRTASQPSSRKHHGRQYRRLAAAIPTARPFTLSMWTARRPSASYWATGTSKVRCFKSIQKPWI
jgi:hypothetical protein